MSVRLLAMELYKVQQKVSALEEELQNPAIPDEKKVRDELRVAKAEQQVLRKMLDGEKAPSPFSSKPSTLQQYR